MSVLDYALEEHEVLRDRKRGSATVISRYWVVAETEVEYLLDEGQVDDAKAAHEVLVRGILETAGAVAWENASKPVAEPG